LLPRLPRHDDPALVTERADADQARSAPADARGAHGSASAAIIAVITMAS
jgi:hypothetical protein